jgi:TetR/AcrR family transcriptional regulator, cholesterol catabolism regulator
MTLEGDDSRESDLSQAEISGVALPEQPEASERVLQILSEAAKLFAANGYERTSMRDIAASCGISKALLYHHFVDKDELYTRLTLGFTRELYAFVAERIPSEGPASRKVLAFMTASAAFFERYRHVWMTSTAAFWSDPKARGQEERIAWRTRYETLLRSLLREGIEAGELRRVDAANAGRLILSALNWMHRWYQPGRGQSAAEIAEAYHDMIFGGLLAGGSGRAAAKPRRRAHTNAPKS